MTVSEIKIERLHSEKLRNMFEQIQKMKKSRAIVIDFLFSFLYIFASFCSRTISKTALESLYCTAGPTFSVPFDTFIEFYTYTKNSEFLNTGLYRGDTRRFFHSRF